LKRKIVNKEHVNEALTQYLRALSVLAKNEEVTSFYKVTEGLNIKIEEVND
jgi:thioredoxin-related protein